MPRPNAGPAGPMTKASRNTAGPTPPRSPVNQTASPSRSALVTPTSSISGALSSTSRATKPSVPALAPGDASATHQQDHATQRRENGHVLTTHPPTPSQCLHSVEVELAPGRHHRSPEGTQNRIIQPRQRRLSPRRRLQQLNPHPECLRQLKLHPGDREQPIPTSAQQKQCPIGSSLKGHRCSSSCGVILEKHAAAPQSAGAPTASQPPFKKLCYG